MFGTKSVPCYIERLGYRWVKVGKRKVKGAEMVVRVEPFTAECATEIPGAKLVAFRLDTAESNDDYDRVALAFEPPPQTIDFRPGSSMSKPELTIESVRVKGLKLQRGAKGQHWSLTFSMEIPDSPASELAYLKEALFEQRHLTFFTAQAGLFVEADEEERRDSPAAKPAPRGGGNATAH